MAAARFLFTDKADPSGNRALLRMSKDRILLRVAHGIYAHPTGEAVAAIVRRHWYEIVAYFVPEGVVTDRTGFDIYPVPDKNGLNHMFLSAPRTRTTIRVSSLMIHVRSGAGPVEGDAPFMGTWSAGLARRHLDNLAPSRVRQGPARTLGRKGIERRLDFMRATKGVEGLERLKQEARRIAPLVGRDHELELLKKLIEARA